jgi:hypothetical protein
VKDNEELGVAPFQLTMDKADEFRPRLVALFDANYYCCSLFLLHHQ